MPMVKAFPRISETIYRICILFRIHILAAKARARPNLFRIMNYSGASGVAQKGCASVAGPPLHIHCSPPVRDPAGRICVNLRAETGVSCGLSPVTGP
jgi:hypothetical protein